MSTVSSCNTVRRDQISVLCTSSVAGCSLCLFAEDISLGLAGMFGLACPAANWAQSDASLTVVHDG